MKTLIRTRYSCHFSLLKLKYHLASVQKYLFVASNTRASVMSVEGYHGLKQGTGSTKLSGRCSLLTPTLPPEEGKRRKRERDVQTEYKKFY